MVAERPSELLIVPALAAPWVLHRDRIRPGLLAPALAAGLFLVPFASSVALNVARGVADRPPARDEVFRDGLPGADLSGEVTFPYTAGGGLVDRAGRAASFGLGLTWSPRISFAHAADALPKYLWLVGGAGIWGGRFAPARSNDPLLRGGVTIGLPGFVLALAGAIRWRREAGWVLLGLGLVAGNLLFVAFYWAFDRMTFTVPAAAGICFLAGLGCAAPPGAPAPRRPRLRAAWLALPLALVAVNAAHVNRNTAQNRDLVAQRAAIARAPWPRDSVILSTFWPAMTYRYLIRAEARRDDVRVIHVAGGSHARAARHLLGQGRTLFITPGLLDPSEETVLRARTAEPWAKLGLIRLDAAAAGPSGGRP